MGRYTVKIQLPLPFYNSYSPGSFGWERIVTVPGQKLIGLGLESVPNGYWAIIID